MWFEITEQKMSGKFILTIGELKSDVSFSFSLPRADIQYLAEMLKGMGL